MIVAVLFTLIFGDRGVGLKLVSILALLFFGGVWVIQRERRKQLGLD